MLLAAATGGGVRDGSSNPAAAILEPSCCRPESAAVYLPYLKYVGCAAPESCAASSFASAENRSNAAARSWAASPG
jgi:hypothetical protein